MESTDIPIRLAILDDYANAATRHFEHIPNLVIEQFPSTLNPAKPEELKMLVERLEPFMVISSMRERTPFPAALISRLPNLKLLLNSSRRNKGIDMDAASAQNIIVTGTTNVTPTDSQKRAALGDEMPPPADYQYVIQHAWALLLGLCSRISEADRVLKMSTSGWHESGYAISLGGKTLGVLGLGKLGVAMAKVAVASFDMKVIAWSENLTQEKADDAAISAGFGKGTFKVVSKDALFRESDVVSLHNVLSDRSRGVVGASELGKMKRQAILVNTSRGGLIDEQALIDTLKNGRIEGVALDVFWEEPLGAESVWRKTDEWSKSSVVLSPHMGYVFSGLMNRFYQEQAEILEAWLRGEDVQPRMN